MTPAALKTGLPVPTDILIALLNWSVVAMDLG